MTERVNSMAARRMPLRAQMRASLTALCLLCPAAAHSAELSQDILGTWQLYDAQIVSLEDSMPRGMLPVKEHYTADGRLYFISPTGVEDAKTPYATYKIEGTRRTIRLRGQQQTYAAVLSMPTPDTLEVTQAGGDVWHYHRIGDADATSKRIEPLSVERLPSPGGGNWASFEYDTKDYSALAQGKRIIGTWEVIANKGVSSDEAPPYGYFNDVWMFDGRTVTVEVRGSPQDRRNPPNRYELKGGVLRMGKDAAGVMVSYNEWGHLVLTTGSRVVILKRMSTKPVLSRLPPLRIALLSLLGEPEDL